jgi:hypothetical protein
MATTEPAQFCRSVASSGRASRGSLKLRKQDFGSLHTALVGKLPEFAPGSEAEFCTPDFGSPHTDLVGKLPEFAPGSDAEVRGEAGLRKSVHRFGGQTSRVRNRLRCRSSRGSRISEVCTPIWLANFRSSQIFAVRRYRMRFCARMRARSISHVSR